MTRTLDLATCDAGALVDAFDAARGAIVPDLATCSARDLAVAFDRARGGRVLEFRSVGRILSEERFTGAGVDADGAYVSTSSR